MKCPFCSSPDSRVIDSRTINDGSTVRRRRECSSCEKRFTTYEKIEAIPLMVIKKDGSREVFDNTKLMAGIMKACEKRPISMDTMQNVTDEIEKELRNTLEMEVTSQAIGQLVMEKLKAIDQVAYVRFASVYREFKDVNDFVQELEKLFLHEKEK